MLSIFSGVSHLYVFFGEMYVQVFSALFDWVVCFSGIELHEQLVHFGDKLFVSCVYLCFYFHYSGRWVLEDLAVIYVRECFAYIFL